MQRRAADDAHPAVRRAGARLMLRRTGAVCVFLSSSFPSFSSFVSRLGQNAAGRRGAVLFLGGLGITMSDV